MKKYVKTIIIVSVLALMCIAYFFYLSNRKSTKDATDKSVWNQEVAALTTKDIDKNYPESPKEVVKLYEADNVISVKKRKEKEYDKLADMIRTNMDIEMVYKIIEL